MKVLNLTVTLLVIVMSLNAQEIPQKISYQGKLLQNGERVDGTRDITFTIGSWSETHQNVQINEGLYSVKLGKNNPIPVSLFSNTPNLKLEIQVEGENLTPNTDLLSVPYAYKAQKAENTFSGDYTDLTNTPSFSNVATSGDYNDLLNTPDFSGWDKDASDDFSGNWSDLLNKPNLADVATSGDYNDLNNAPSINIKSGEVGPFSQFSSGWHYKSVTFSKSFSNEPIVVVSFEEGSGQNQTGKNSLVFLGTSKVSKNGFTIDIYDNDSGGTADVVVNWIAIGK